MKNLTNEFLDEIEQTIKRREFVKDVYQFLNVGLGVIIAACGFLTAAASQTELKTTWISSPTALLMFGLLSAISAIINQIMTPGQRYAHHKIVRLALQHIRGEVKFRKMTVKDAQALRTLALTKPEFVLGKLEGESTGDADLL
jgi:FtsH-binding integral membrane protein